MINTMKMYEELSETMDSKSAKKIVEMMSYMYEEIQNTVTKTEFNELKDIVKDLSIKVGELTTGQKALAEAQKRTEDKVTELAEAQKRTEDKVTELAKAQKRTEDKVTELAEAQKRTEDKVAELAEAQKRTEDKVTELAEAQKRTEDKVTELAEAQKRTEDKVTELAEAQKRTEDKVTELAETLTKLVKEHDDTKRQMGGIAQSIGYNLEDKAYKALPALLKRDFNITIEGRLIRDYVKDNKEREFEVNIFGKGKRGGKDIIIIGESKTVLSENDIKSFIRKRIETLKDVFKEEIFPVLVTRSVSNSKVKEFAKSVNLHIYYSYDF